MADTTNNISDKKLRLTIRICKDNMAFSVGDPQESGQLVYEPYHMNAGISIAANLREAFHVSELLQSGYKRVLIELDAPVMLVPTDEYAGQDIEALYHHTYHQNGSEEILSSVLPDLNAVAVFSINKDLKLVIDDHFQDIRIQPLMQSVWTHCYRRSSLEHGASYMLTSMQSNWRSFVSNRTVSDSATLLLRHTLMTYSIIYFTSGN